MLLQNLFIECNHIYTFIINPNYWRDWRLCTKKVTDDGETPISVDLYDTILPSNSNQALIMLYNFDGRGSIINKNMMQLNLCSLLGFIDLILLYIHN